MHLSEAAWFSMGKKVFTTVTLSTAERSTAPGKAIRVCVAGDRGDTMGTASRGGPASWKKC